MYMYVSLICLKRGLNFENKLCHCHYHIGLYLIFLDLISYLLVIYNIFQIWQHNIYSYRTGNPDQWCFKLLMAFMCSQYSPLTAREIFYKLNILHLKADKCNLLFFYYY